VVCGVSCYVGCYLVYSVVCALCCLCGLFLASFEIHMPCLLLSFIWQVVICVVMWCLVCVTAA